MDDFPEDDLPETDVDEESEDNYRYYVDYSPPDDVEYYEPYVGGDCVLPN